MNKKKKTSFNQVTDRDLKLLFVLISIIVLAISYFFGCRRFVEQTDTVKAENQTLQAEVNELTEMWTHEAEKKMEIAQYNEVIQAIYDRFPGAMTEEKSIEILTDLESETDMPVSAVTFTINEQFYSEAEMSGQNTTTTTTDSSDGESATEETTTDINSGTGTTTANGGVVGYKTTLVLEFTTNYDGLKKAIDYVNDSEDKMSIDTITVEFDAETGNLKGSMNLCMYALDGIGAAYVEPKISDVKLGLSDIFGSFNLEVNNAGNNKKN